MHHFITHNLPPLPNYYTKNLTNPQVANKFTLTFLFVVKNRLKLFFFSNSSSMFQAVIPVKQKAMVKNSQRIQVNADFDKRMPI